MNLNLNNFKQENNSIEKNLASPNDPDLSIKLAELQQELQTLKQSLVSYQELKEERDQLLVSDKLLKHQLQNAIQNTDSTSESITDAFYSLDRQWCFTFLNTQAEMLLTKTRQELIGLNIWQVFPEAVGSSFYRQFHHSLETGATLNFEEYYSSSNNWFEVHVCPTDQGLIVYLNNINQRKRAQQDLEEQRLKLNTILDSTMEGLYGLDMAGKCTFINRAALALFGYREDECLGKDMHELTHYNYPDGKPYPSGKCPYMANLAAGKPVKLAEEVLWHKDGSPLPTLYSCSPVIENRQIVGGVVTIIDLRERKQARALLAETEARFRVIWESASDAVALSDPDGTVIEANPAYYELYGLQPEQVINQNFSIIFPEEMRELAKKQYLDTFRGPKLVQAFEAVVKRADGTGRIVEASYDFITQSGVRTAMVSVVRDITERRQAQEALQKALSELTKLDQLKDEFVSIIVHDLSNPLTSINGHGYLIKNNLINISSLIAEAPVEHRNEDAIQLFMAKMFASLEALLHQCERMKELISRLLEFTRLEAGRLTLNYGEPANLLDLVRRVVEDENVTTVDAAILLEIPKGETEILISFDEARLEQVLSNLISNAIKYSPKRTTIIVGIESRPAANEVFVWVKDQGYGISKEAQLHLFERFYREYSNKTKGIQGLGLGLYISYEIIREHGGRMWVESQPGTGSTFYFTLPLAGYFIRPKGQNDQQIRQ